MEDLKYQIKKWEHDFQKSHHRVPSKQDIKLHPEIRNLYKSYHNFKKPKDVKVEEKNEEDLVDIQISEVVTDTEEIETSKPAELGPTPQANGKVLSIFDFRLTPPESSPLKGRKNKLPPPNDIFKTPTKTRVRDLLEVKGTSLTSKFQSLSDSPSKQFTGLETPQYLGKNNKKFDFSIPSTAEINSSPIAPSPSKTVLVTPTKAIPTFLISPSPLKPHRFLNKKLSDVFNEFKNIQEENLEEQFEEEIEHESDYETDTGTETGSTYKRKKKFTQKRTTRRFKMKPRLAEETSDKLVRKDVHKEIAKLTKTELEKINTAMHSEEVKEEHPETDSDEEYVKQDPKNTKGMVKRTNNNFQRLKINDPRAKAFKRRMRR